MKCLSRHIGVLWLCPTVGSHHTILIWWGPWASEIRPITCRSWHGSALQYTQRVWSSDTHKQSWQKQIVSGIIAPLYVPSLGRNLTGKGWEEVHMLWGRRDRVIPLWRGKMRPAAVAVNKVHQNTWLPAPGRPRTSGSLRLHINKTMLFFLLSIFKTCTNRLRTQLPGT